MVPKLLAALRSRGVLDHRRALGGKASVGAILNAFLDRMNDIWDNELDPAWNRISGQDYEAERAITEEHDRFHQEYLHAFEAAIRRAENGDTLRQTCDAAVARSLECAALVWRRAAESKLNMHQKSMKKSKKAISRAIRSLDEQAVGLLRRGIKVRGSSDKMKLFKNAIDLVDQASELASREG